MPVQSFFRRQRAVSLCAVLRSSIDAGPASDKRTPVTADASADGAETEQEHR